MDKYSALQKIIGIKFKNSDLLNTVFMHRSYVNEHKNVKEHNERLEFLGDAVLELAVTEFLYKKYPSRTEGTLTDLRSALVKGPHLADISRELDLGKYLYLSHGEEIGGGRGKPYILANTLEALIGAIYIDKGYKEAHKFTEKFILKRLNEIIGKGLHIDSKSLLQEITQEKELCIPLYKVISASGPDHAKYYKVGVYLKDEFLAEGSGPSKQRAEQEAAAKALKKKGWN
ncbi:ribonuclease III [Candidatus Peregrinibacteria bacterium]|nr:ribonuclease III [Candidatus Peregrinibacteria bacterium]